DVADPDREAHLEVDPRVLKWLPHLGRHVEAGPRRVEPRSPWEAVGDADLGVGVALRPRLERLELRDEARALVGRVRGGAKAEEDRHSKLRGPVPERPPGWIVEGSAARDAVRVLGDDLDRVEALD